MVRRVEKLLHVHDEEPEFLESPPIAPTIAHGRDPVVKIGAQIGSYKLLQRIGEGGFGVVFMAQQVEPVKRKVALKVDQAGHGYAK